MKHVFITLLFSSFLFGGGLKISQTDKDIIYNLFNGQVTIADSLLNYQLELYPESPKHNMLKAQYYFYARFMSNINLSRDSILTLIENYAYKTISHAENLEQTTDVKFYVGTAYGYLSRVYGMQREYWNAYWAARDCYNYLEEVLEEDPEYYDAYMGLGVIEYYTGARLTGIINTIVWLVGMSGDRQTGLDYFNYVYRHGSLFQPEAHFALALMYRSVENDLAKAESLVNEYIENYPDNGLVHRYKEELLIYRAIEDEGVPSLAAQKDSLVEKYNIANSFVINTIGYNYIRQNRLDVALALFKLNLELFPQIANCYDSLAECFMTRGEYTKAIEYYKLALEILPSDDTVNDQAKITFRERVDEQLEELNDLIRT